MPDQGVTSYKLFMAYKGAIMVDDETLFRTMQVGGQDRRARDGPRRERRCDRRARQAGARRGQDRAALACARPGRPNRRRGNGPRDQARAPRGLPALRRPRLLRRGDRAGGGRPRAGWRTWGETCTQYLFIDETPRGAGLRRREVRLHAAAPAEAHNQELLWRALRTGVLSVVSTDHCPFRWSDQKALGRDDFSKIPNGGPGIENRLHMLHHFGVRRGG